MYGSAATSDAMTETPTRAATPACSLVRGTMPRPYVRSAKSSTAPIAHSIARLARDFGRSKGTAPAGSKTRTSARILSPASHSSARREPARSKLAPMHRRLCRHAGPTDPARLRGSLATGRSTVLAPRTFVRLPGPAATGYGFALVRPLLVAIASVGLLFVAARPAAAAPPPWYPPLRWLPAASANYTPGRGGTAIGTIVIHATEGPYDGALSWFQDPHASSSAHYVIRASDGEITQMVAEADTAFHARGVNRSAIGIEHEFDPDQGIGYTDPQYRSSATLVCAITKRYGIPADRAHIIGHNEVPGTDHTDPGPTWNWPFYMSLVAGCAGS